jgi:hypothetical protein
MQERNISSYWRTDGRRPVYLKAIFKTNFNTTLMTPRVGNHKNKSS